MRLLRDLLAVFLAVVIAVVPAWAGAKACAARGERSGAPMACCLTPESEDAPALSCCCERAEPDSSLLLQAFARSGCNCRLDPGTPARSAAPQEAESALERELRARFDACTAGLVVAAPTPEPLRTHTATGRAPTLRAPPPGRALSASERLTRLCIARL